MVFVLMGLMALFFILSTIVGVFLSIYKNGKLLEKKWIFITISIIIFIELCIGITSLPSNYILKKSIDGFLMILLAGNLFVYKNNFNASRFILGITSIATLIALLQF